MSYLANEGCRSKTNSQLNRHGISFVCERMKSLKFRRESFLVVGTPEVTLTQVAVGCVNGQPSGAAH